MTKYRYILVLGDSDVVGTDNEEVYKAALADGETIAIDTIAGKSGIDGSVDEIERADEADFLGDDADEAGEAGEADGG